MTFSNIFLTKSRRMKAISENPVCMKWMNTFIKQTKVRECSARRICSTRAEALKSAWSNSTCNFFFLSIVAVKQYESNSLYKSLCNSTSFELRRILWSSKIMFWQKSLKYILILQYNFSTINKTWDENDECITLKRLKKNSRTSLQLKMKTNSLSTNKIINIDIVKINRAFLCWEEIIHLSMIFETWSFNA